MKQNPKQLLLVCCFCLVALCLITDRCWAEAANATIKIMTLNLHNGKDAGRHPNFDRFIQLVKDQQPDVISLQEVQAKQIKSLQIAGYQAIAGPNANYALFRFGNALLTKHKIIYHRHHYLPSQKEQRGVDEVLLEINGYFVRILNTHLGLTWAEQQQQVAEITRICSYLDGPLIITGDFNFEPDHKLLAQFPFKEVSQVLGGYKTFPAQQPQAQTDQIWYSAEFKPLEAQPLNWYGSDHLPVTASLVFQTTTVLPVVPVAIPDSTLQHNPLLPDIGYRTTHLKVFRLKDSAADTIKNAGLLELPFAGQFSALLGYDGEASQLKLSAFKTLDLRDYASLLGVRGKAQWDFSVAVNSDERFWWEWSQFYRWSNHWGSEIIISSQDEQPRFIWEQSYLPLEKLRLMCGGDSDRNFRAGIAFTPDKRQVFEAQYRQVAAAKQYRLSWQWQW